MEQEVCSESAMLEFNPRYVVRYRVLAQIPPCVLEDRRTNSLGKQAKTTDRLPLSNFRYCCMASPPLSGCLINWSTSEFIKRGNLASDPAKSR